LLSALTESNSIDIAEYTHAMHIRKWRVAQQLPAHALPRANARRKMSPGFARKF
jgi:hypothetical protein